MKTERNHTCQWLSQSRSSCSCLIWSIAHSFSERLDVDWVFCWATCASTWACRPKLSSVVGLNDGFVVVFSLSCLMCHVLMYFFAWMKAHQPAMRDRREYSIRAIPPLDRSTQASFFEGLHRRRPWNLTKLDNGVNEKNKLWLESLPGQFLYHFIYSGSLEQPIAREPSGRSCYLPYGSLSNVSRFHHYPSFHGWLTRTFLLGDWNTSLID